MVLPQDSLLLVWSQPVDFAEVNRLPGAILLFALLILLNIIAFIHSVLLYLCCSYVVHFVVLEKI